MSEISNRREFAIPETGITHVLYMTLHQPMCSSPKACHS